MFKTRNMNVAVACALTTLAALVYAGEKQAESKKAESKNADTKGAEPKSSGGDDSVKRGEYLVKVLGCGDCHTPMKLTGMGPAPDEARLLSGHPEMVKLPDPPKLPPGPWLVVSSATNTAFAGPWGISYAANLTPDTNTGLGIWTEQMFFDAIRQGKHMGTSRPVLPPMPIRAYSQLTDADLKAVFDYLKSIPAIANHVPDAKPPAGKAKTFTEETK